MHQSGVVDLAAEVFGAGRAALVDEGQDVEVGAAQLVDDAPGMHRDFADIGVVQLRRDATDARGLGQGGGPGEDLAGDGLGVEGGVLGDVVVDRLQIGAGARGPAQRRGYQASISRASSSLETVRPASTSFRPCWTFPST